MDGWSRWDILLIAVTMYVATMSLVRLMRARRDRLVSEVQQQLDAEKLRRKKLRKKQAQLLEQTKKAA